MTHSTDKMQTERKQHWENIYNSKQIDEVSWYQSTPETSLNFVRLFNIPKTAKIIDIGGGDSFFVDHLLEMGFHDITVLDISGTAIEKAKKRLGSLAHRIKWIVADAANFMPTEKYDFWHDRAAFHFLTNEDEISSYVEIAGKSINENGFMVIGTFSEQGPTKCSGIEISQYSEAKLTGRFREHFESLGCFTVDHTTPFNTVQNFIFCSFRKKS